MINISKRYKLYANLKKFECYKNIVYLLKLYYFSL